MPAGIKKNKRENIWEALVETGYLTIKHQKIVSFLTDGSVRRRRSSCIGAVLFFGFFYWDF